MDWNYWPVLDFWAKFKGQAREVFSKNGTEIGSKTRFSVSEIELVPDLF